MVFVFPRNSEESEFVEGAKKWLQLLEVGPDDGYQKAWDFLHHPANEHWSLPLMRASIETYGAPYDQEPPKQPYRVTSIDEEIPIECYEYQEGPDRGCLEIDLPLNHTVSDLTVQLAIVLVPEGLAFVLQDIHVL